MKITSEITIHCARQRVIELITNPDNTAKWQSGIKSIEQLTGEKDQVGSTSRVVFEFNGFQLEVVETVIKRSPPHTFASSFEARGVKNTVVNRFYEIGPERTHWIMDHAFHFGGMMSMAGLVLRPLVAQQAAQSMVRFKSFAERI